MSSISKYHIFRFLHEEEGDGMKLSLATLVLSLMLVLYIISGPLLKKFQVKIIRPSGLVMILGILITLLTSSQSQICMHLYPLYSANLDLL